MRKFIAAILFAVSCSVTAAEVYNPYGIGGLFYGRLETLEVYRGDQWLDISDSIRGDALTITTGTIYSARHCPERELSPDYCNSIGTLGGGINIMTLSSPSFRMSPDADLPCEGEYRTCDPYDPFRIWRTGGVESVELVDQMQQTHTGFFGWDLIKFTLTGDFADTQPLDLLALYGIDGNVTGTGSFFQYRNTTCCSSIAIGEGSYRGTFSIHTGYVPTPGTLALIAMGLVFGLRRHARSKVASH